MRAGSAAASGVRHVLGVSLQALLIVAIVGVTLLLLGPIYEPADALVGAGTAEAAGESRYPGTLVASPDTLRAGESFTVTGCHYDTDLGNVVVRFAGGGWGSPLDADGCFTIAGIPAMAGDSMPAGEYEVSAYQYLRGRWRETGDTTVTVLP